MRSLWGSSSKDTTASLAHQERVQDGKDAAADSELVGRTVRAQRSVGGGAAEPRTVRGAGHARAMGNVRRTGS